MNHVINDLGETVIAVGAPGSLARVKCTHPTLIAHLEEMRAAEAASSGLGEIDQAPEIAEMLHGRGLVSKLEVCSILEAAGYPEGAAPDVWRQVKLLNSDHDRQLRASTLALTPLMGAQDVQLGGAANGHSLG